MGSFPVPKCADLAFQWVPAPWRHLTPGLWGPFFGAGEHPDGFREQLLALTTGRSLEYISDNQLFSKGNRG